jgi:hypothetical protein
MDHKTVAMQANDENYYRNRFREVLNDLRYIEVCRGCARTIKHDWVFVPRHISKYDIDRRTHYTFCSEQCYEDVSWCVSYIDEKSGNLYIWDDNQDNYVLYNVPGKFYP